MSAGDTATVGGATVGGFVIRLLEAYGVDIVFGMPGVHTLELYRGLEGASIRHVLVRHEQGAAVQLVSTSSCRPARVDQLVSKGPSLPESRQFTSGVIARPRPR